MTTSISIHALREEGDAFDLRDAVNGFVFLSTPSARRATQGLEQYNRHNQNFYPRPLRGGRPIALGEATATAIFLSTPSARRATPRRRRSRCRCGHFYPRPLRGGRPNKQSCGIIQLKFLSTPSARRATEAEYGSKTPEAYFYPRPLRGGRRLWSWRHAACLFISIHALCEEGDPITAPSSSKC